MKFRFFHNFLKILICYITLYHEMSQSHEIIFHQWLLQLNLQFKGVEYDPLLTHFWPIFDKRLFVGFTGILDVLISSFFEWNTGKIVFVAICFRLILKMTVLTNFPRVLTGYRFWQVEHTSLQWMIKRPNYLSKQRFNENTKLGSGDSSAVRRWPVDQQVLGSISTHGKN